MAIRALKGSAILLVGLAAVGVAMALRGTWGGGAGPTVRQPETYGIPECPASATSDLLAAAALQCWLPAAGGRWRILSHVSAHGAVVVDVAATDRQDARAIASAIVTSVGARFSEVLVYVHTEAARPGASTTTRVRWTPQHRFEELVFTSDR